MGPYQYKDIQMLHLEVSSKCNARCPMCARSDAGGKTNPFLPLSELSLEQTQRLLPASFLAQLRKVYLCGNFGDPITARDCLEILLYLRESNPTMTLGIHTNGGARSEDFWSKIAAPLDYCRFGIDGLKDTNHLYRQGVRWETLERNVRAFIDAGGNAEWDFLVFKHNEHQVEQAARLAEHWGVRKFNVKSTSRFFSAHTQVLQTQAPVKNLQGEVTHQLEQAGEERFRNEFYEEQRQIIRKHGSLANYWNSSTVSCRVAGEKSIYLSAQGWAFPCCWVGGEVFSKSLHAQSQVTKLIEAMPEADALNVFEHGLEAVVQGEFFQKALAKSWSQPSIEDGKLKVCAKTCGQELRPFERQFL